MTVPVTLTASPPKVSKSPCYFCSSINGSADRSPTAASTTARILTTAPNRQLEAAYHRADKAIQKIVDVLAAA